MDDRLLIGIDVGTTGVKAALFDAAGGIVRTWSDRYPTQRPGPGLVEQNPYDWTMRVETALAALSHGIAPGRIAAAGLTSQVNTHVFVDAAGAPLMNAIVWQDGRCAEDAADLTAKVPEADRLRWWGAPLPIDASHVLARMAYVARVYPDVWRQTRWVMAPKDFCLHRLTGIVAADPMTSFGVVDSTLAYIPELIGLVPGAAERLPPLAGSTARHGSIGAGLPAAGTPMVTGTMDAWAGLFGAGVCRPGEAVYLGGTSEVLGIVSERKVPTPGVIAFPKCDGVVLHAGPTPRPTRRANPHRCSCRIWRASGRRCGTSHRGRPSPDWMPHTAPLKLPGRCSRASAIRRGCCLRASSSRPRSGRKPFTWPAAAAPPMSGARSAPMSLAGRYAAPAIAMPERSVPPFSPAPAAGCSRPSTRLRARSCPSTGPLSRSHPKPAATPLASTAIAISIGS
jgi:FGGY family of carbohydrate kinases, N-terminal domain